MSPVIFEPIGLIHTPFKDPRKAPIQPRYAEGATGTVEVFAQYEEGLADLAGFSHIILLYHLHLSNGYSLKVVPYLDDTPRGLFATRAPHRPNPLGLSVVRLDKIEKNILYVTEVDMVDGSPLLDIKPYVPEFEKEDAVKIGWLQSKIRKERKAD
ncbi:MAG: tRNA (N6-threonylcarbamoyladenosine(37)-N6)-methyltransferase TrmO [candidate division Zixibacteria bacterium]|nr:tRNA (N6-threonylcarbamoyladenosine(37)-N6)-methyltransferase TrmO [candidate division Zixibacteria bacterium]